MGVVDEVFFEIYGVAVFNDAANLNIGEGEGFRHVSDSPCFDNGFLEDLPVETGD